MLKALFPLLALETDVEVVVVEVVEREREAVSLLSSSGVVVVAAEEEEGQRRGLTNMSKRTREPREPKKRLKT